MFLIQCRVRHSSLNSRFLNKDGKTECERMPHSDTLLTMGIFDEIRKQGGYVYPEGLEKVAPGS